jgi:sulfotransferase family protein
LNVIEAIPMTEVAEVKSLNRRGSRKNAPVFVIGCGRSGTTLLYHMILSAGDFAVYRSESNAINLLEPRFGDLSLRKNRERLMDAWLDSKLFSISGLDREEIKTKVLAECTNGGSFLCIVMEEIARKQGVRRWADCTPEHLLYLPRIKQTIPDALIIHIIRDGRDVALSTEKQGYIRPIPLDWTPRSMVAGLYWEWMVNRGCEDGRRLGPDYMEVRFEELVLDPPRVLRRLGEFIEHDLDYERILKVGIGSVSEPNTSFRSDGKSFSPVGRWKESFSAENLAMFEGLVGGTMQELGYPLVTADRKLLDRAALKTMRSIYRTYFDSKLYLKAKTPLGRRLVTRDLSWL